MPPEQIASWTKSTRATLLAPTAGLRRHRRPGDDGQARQGHRKARRGLVGAGVVAYERLVAEAPVRFARSGRGMRSRHGVAGAPSKRDEGRSSRERNSRDSSVAADIEDPAIALLTETAGLKRRASAAVAHPLHELAAQSFPKAQPNLKGSISVRHSPPARSTMRKLIGLAAAVVALSGAGLALAGQAATNPSGEYIDLNVAATPPIAGTAKAPRGVGVSFDSFTGNRISAGVRTNTTSIVVRFNKGFRTNGALFPSCAINPTAASTCPKSSQVGTGTAEAEIAGANGAAPTFVPAKLIAYNGKPFRSKAPTEIFIAFLNGKPVSELDFTVAQQPSGPYGLTFTQIQFPSSSGPSFGIAKFSVSIPDQTVTRKVHGRSVKVHLIEAPTTCHGSWQFAQTNSFSNAPPLTATDAQPCVKL